MTNIRKPAANPFSAQQLVNTLKGKPTASAQPAPAAAGGWLPTVVKAPRRPEVVDKALYATADAVKAGLEGGLKATKAVNEATVGKRADNTQSYKYQGVIEVGLEALNRTFEGGGMDVAKGVKFVQDNAKKK